MKLLVKCDMCGRESTPSFRRVDYGNGDQDRYEPPDGWEAIDGHLLCNGCTTTVRIAIEDCVRGYRRSGAI